MTRTLSHWATPLLMFVLPLLWIPATGYLTWQMWRAPAPAVDHAVYGAVPPELPWYALAVFVGGTCLLLWMATRISRVQLVEGRLCASNYRTEVRIPWSVVERVSQGRWLNPRLVTLHLRSATPLGRRVHFIPAARSLAIWKEDAVVDELRHLVAEAARCPERRAG